ncbi:MAG: peptidase MA family metallohydrolase [Chloroflexota bacterium]
MVKNAISTGDLLPLTALGWQFPTEPSKTVLAYAESVSAVDYVVRTFGKDALSKLILAYRNGPTDDEAMQAATGQDIAAFQAGWLSDIGAPVPSPFGPQPAPSGPLPSDWGGATASQPPRRRVLRAPRPRRHQRRRRLRPRPPRARRRRRRARRAATSRSCSSPWSRWRPWCSGAS